MSAGKGPELRKGANLHAYWNNYDSIFRKKDPIDKIIGKYNLKKDSYYTESPYVKFHNLADKRTDELQFKWENHIPDGWYGFLGLGNPTPLVFLDAIDEFLDYLKTQDENFKIYQIKIKLGGLRMHLGSDKIENLNEMINKLCDVMSDKFLVY